MRLNRRGMGMLVTAVLLLSACTGAVGASDSEPGVRERAVAVVWALDELPDEVVPKDLAGLYGTDWITIVDVREEWEYAEGHIPGALLIPLGSLSQRLGEIPTDEPVVLVCRSGNRSGEAYRLLTEQGFSNVSNMLGGMTDWAAAGLETTR